MMSYMTCTLQIGQSEGVEISHPKIQDNCDPLSNNPAHPTNNEFELEAILSARVLFQRKSVAPC